MSESYKRELIGRAVTRRFEDLVGSVHEVIAEAERIEILREIRNHTQICIRRTNEAIKFSAKGGKI